MECVLLQKFALYFTGLLTSFCIPPAKNPM